MIKIIHYTMRPYILTTIVKNDVTEADLIIEK